jgi:hypothetical protein
MMAILDSGYSEDVKKSVADEGTTKSTPFQRLPDEIIEQYVIPPIHHLRFN